MIISPNQGSYLKPASSMKWFNMYRVTRRVFSKSVTSKLHILFKKILAGSLKTLKVTRISAMYTNFLHPPVHSGPSKFSRPKIWNWSLGNTKANKNLVNDHKPHQNNYKKFWLAGFLNTSKILQNKEKNILKRVRKIWKSFFAEEMLCLLLVLSHFVVSHFI